MITDCRRAAAEAVALLTSRPSSLGDGRLVCVDGRSGSGKSTFAACLVAALHESDIAVRLVELESAYAGWDGLIGTPEHAAACLLAPLADGRPGTLRTWDWHQAAMVADRRIDPLAPGEVLVIEGVGAGASPIRAYASVLVWCEAPADERRERAAARDASIDWWEGWTAQEDVLLAGDPVRDHADFRVRTGRSGMPG